jgi:hypothetical protein
VEFDNVVPAGPLAAELERMLHNYATLEDDRWDMLMVIASETDLASEAAPKPAPVPAPVKVHILGVLYDPRRPEDPVTAAIQNIIATVQRRDSNDVQEFAFWWREIS